MMINTRAIAAKILSEVLRDKKSLTELFQTQIPYSLKDRDRGLVKEYCYGVLRGYQRLKIIADALVYKPIKSREQEISALLLIGLYQLIVLNTPAHAAVSETVAAAHILNKTWAKGLINQALHQFLKRKDFFLQMADAHSTGKYSHPQWMIDALKVAWPQHWQLILDENNRHAPMFLRVNLQKNSRKEYLQRLRQHGIEAFPMEGLPAALRLSQPYSVERLPGFNEGCCSVQDLASQSIVPLLDLQPGQRVLDACAAPGGKTGHILEEAPDLTELVAIDQDSERLCLVKENITRLQLPTTFTRLFTADAAQPENWWDSQPFDRILLDAPCSGTGVIRRHPDIKILRRPDDLIACAHRQSELLAALWPLLKKDGRLLYTTCAIFPIENEEIIEDFCRKNIEAISLPIACNTGVAQKRGHQLFPANESHDGFYYALLVKK